MEKFRDQNLPAAERARDLLSRMTRKEKIGQLNQRLYGFRIYERKHTPEGEEVVLSDEFREEVLKYGGMGALYGLYRADPWADKDYTTGLTGVLARKAYNQVQRFAVEHSRFGIPVLMSSECPHGHQALDGYLLPVNLAAGATFDPELIRSAYRVCGRQLAQDGVDLALVSMLDVLRDPRWGRSEECYGEDPVLCARMAQAAVKGMKEGGPAVVAKHFAAQGEGTGGVNASAARIGERELREIHLPPMAACAREGVQGVMAAYNEIDGIYCHVNKWLLTDVLRKEMGFDGIVMSDGVAIDQLDLMTGDNVVSGALALSAGVDMGLWDYAFGRLEEAAERGLVTDEEIDRAALRVLTLKFERGLFEHPYLEETEGEIFSVRRQPESLQMAKESMVLLKNDGILPLCAQTTGKILVTGPNADALYNQLGDYTPPLRETEGTTVLQGLSQALGAARVDFAPGCYLRERDEDLLCQARKKAESCDAVVCVLGGSSSRFSGATFDSNGAALTDEQATARITMDCGEGMDCAVLELPAAQLELLSAMAESGRPVITLVIAGRPLALTQVCERSGAVVLAFYPGPAGGEAAAEILTGKENPSGRLPVSLPRSSGQVPVYYNYRNSYKGMHYMDEKEGPLYPFGYGLDYGEYVWSCGQCPGKVTMAELEKDGVTVGIRVKNVGGRDGSVVAQLYVTDVAASVARRVKELKAFEKVRLKAGEEKEIRLLLDRDALSIWNNQMKFGPEPGTFLLELADQGKTIWKGELELCI